MREQISADLLLALYNKLRRKALTILSIICPSSRHTTRMLPLTKTVIGLTCLLGILAISSATAQRYILPAKGDSLVGETFTVNSRWQDTLLDIARVHNQGYKEITSANQSVDVLLPGEGTPVRIPALYILPDAPQKGIVLNLAELRLYHFPQYQPGETRQVVTYPVGIGRLDKKTPIGYTHVVEKRRNPTWIVPESIRREYLVQNLDFPKKVPPGPDNPLGDFALRLSLPGYLLHGTNKSYGIGMYVSNGCVRLYSEDIEELYHSVQLDTPVHIINQPYKAGWRGDTLFLEVHPDNYGQDDSDRASRLINSIIRATNDRKADIDWHAVDITVRHADGVPAAIGRQIHQPKATLRKKT